ncbi:Dual specificity tyrosine-phosphorylation-regulated kinase 4 [Tritrichomonas foetus]|uniref:dual-specificity kinase n=1 Tax=Tritrichomonas foetus TaxID=1144522 RepID=A0A1J4J725_9EUKA|nr:Dual specificity tyrosine-phosphorylation-regulated kinase 4 [Tritrichomonas foetus]|eukprot:OHS94968.1 Dual specificity tyrosine-phosphorylation-regulated kinase 4 [Tritrichomonas foetus]
MNSARYKPHVPQIPIHVHDQGRKNRRIKSNVHLQPSHPAAPQPPQSDNGGGQNPRFRRQPPPLSHRDDPSKNLSPVIPNAPISPQEAIDRYSSLMTRYETSEILNFPSVFFLGNKARKHEPIRSDRYNFGFDTKNHAYKVSVGDHLAYRFEVLNTFGSGAFGQVVRAFDHKNQTHVAIKIVVNTEQMHEQGQIEAKILARLNKCAVPNVVRAFDFFIFRSHICVTFEVLGKNLYEMIQSNHYHPFPPFFVRNYATQILIGLEGIHNAGIVHCDIKPENILLNANTQKNSVKIIDFGSGCFEGHQKYEYIQSRFYRAPEVVLGISYGPPMDIWSAALVIIELLIGKPIFPCSDELELLWMISELIGPPPIELVKTGKRRGDFFDNKLNMKLHKGRPRMPSNTTLQSVLNINDPFLIDFLTKCLTWDQNERMTAKDALQHPWILTKTVSVSIPEPQQVPSILPELRNPQKIE